MNKQTTVKLKIFALVALGLLATLAATSYFGTFDTERTIAGIEKRWEALKTIPVPKETAVVLEQPLNGGPKSYGITLSRRSVLDVSDLVDPKRKITAAEIVRQHYVDWLLQWHPGLTVAGRIDDAQTVEGEAGLGVVQTEGFWYEEIRTGRIHPEIAEIVLDRYTPEEGRGRRFVVVRIILCTRPR